METRTRTRNACVCWTGGKDCSLALARLMEDIDHGSRNLMLKCLVVFRPLGGGKGFKAHPLNVMEMQVKAIGVPLVQVPIEANDGNYQTAYVQALTSLRDGPYQIEVVVTGDIDLVGRSSSNWMTDRCMEAGMECWLPLWQEDRHKLLEELVVQRRFETIYSCVKSPWFDERWIGKRLDAKAIEDMRQIHAKQDGANSKQLDLCGENGEYHTITVFAPKLFKQRVEFSHLGVSLLQGEPGQGKEKWWCMSEKMASSVCLSPSVVPQSVT